MEHPSLLSFIMKNTAIATVFILFINALSYGQNMYSYSQPKELADGWKTSHLKSQSIDTTRIYQLFTQVQNGKNKLHSVVFIKNNQIIIEEYFNGYSANDQHDIRSATKSIVSILLGIAIDKGFIDNEDDLMSTYLKSKVPTKNLDKRKDKITIRHLLTMSSGLDCNDWDRKSEGQEDKVYKKKDWIQYTLDLPMVNEPGTVSNYCTMGVILVSEIISQASGMTIQAFAEKYLFQPLDISNISWSHPSHKEIIPSGKRLYMTSRDMAKIGQLILNNGTWNGEQLVSEKWIEESTTVKTKITGIDYGYLWWNIPFMIQEKMFIAKIATGNGGQYIMTFPELDIVAVFTGGAYNSQEDKLPFAIMRDVFLPTLITDK